MYTLSHLISDNQLDSSIISDLSKSTYYSFGLSAIVLDEQNEKISGCGKSQDIFHLLEDLKKEFITFLNQSTLPNTYFYIFDSSFDFSFIVALLKDSQHYYGSLLAGPFFPEQVSEHRLNEIIRQKKYALTERNTIKAVFDDIPLIPHTRIYYVERALSSLLTNPNLLPLREDIQPSKPSADDILPEIHIDMDFDNTNYNYSFEKLFLAKVSGGDIDQVIRLFHEQVKTSYLSGEYNHSLRTGKNNAVIFNTLLSRASIHGGVDPEYSLNIAKDFMLLIEKAESTHAVVDLMEDMAAKYTNSVLHVATINHVSVIKKASKYVHNHLSEPIRLQDVAGYVGLSPNYFSSLFKKEMNLAFADYVNHTRIKESQYLLKTTNHSILDIALSVGFNNQNYFTTIFKKTTGITPKQYRMRSTKSNDLD